MTAYIVPLRDIRFAITELADVASVLALPGYEDANPELIDAILDEASRMASDVLAPLNRSGDQAGAQLEA